MDRLHGVGKKGYMFPEAGIHLSHKVAHIGVSQTWRTPGAKVLRQDSVSGCAQLEEIIPRDHHEEG